MSSASLSYAGLVGIGERLDVCVRLQGSAAHSYLASHALLEGPDSARNLCDAVHLLCTLHGRYPGIVDHAARQSLEPTAKAWLDGAVEAFAIERALLTRLAVAAGPVPGTPGAAGTEATVIGQRHALGMLAQSERKGCALGAALALAIDWIAVRNVLDSAAARFGVVPPPYELGDIGSIFDLLETIAGTASIDRALLFGAEQIAVQQYGLWDLLEVRQQARGGI